MSYSVQQLLNETYKDELKEMLSLGVYFKFSSDGGLIGILEHEGSFGERFGFYDDFRHAIERAENALETCDKCGSLSFDLSRDNELENRICNKCRGEG